MGSYSFEIFIDKDKQYRFRMIAPNGKIILQSEGYHNSKDCIDTINSVKVQAHSAKIVHKYMLNGE